jgi:isoamylase
MIASPPEKSLPEHLLPGRVWPLGAHAIEDATHGAGVNVAVFSQRAKLMELCVFDDSGAHELKRYPMHGADDGIFHGFLPGLGAGMTYGFRAHGSYKPESGYRFNPHKLLLDPYARAIVGPNNGTFQWRPEHFAYAHGHPEGGRVMDTRDNAAFALKARVLPSLPTATRPPAHPRQPLSEVVLYELHVKGFTMRMPGIPDALRGTYAGLAHPAAIAHLKRLGVTTLSLLPVQTALHESGLDECGLVNYWGYNTIGFFCPDARYAACRKADAAQSEAAGIGGVVEEFRAMVAALQAAGFEVVLDVVYNHTPEGNENGPTISFRGLDNPSWYRLAGDDRSRYENSSGCGNTLRAIHPRVTQFVLDSLRYWVDTMGVDGFRFDLAPALGRTRHGFDASAPFWVALRQDPTLANVHLIAEPWDCGHDGYQLGRLPGRFAEWNDRFRDAVRSYWLGSDAHHGREIGRSEFARRFTASSDLFHHGHRLPAASVNFIAAHDGRTLTDVVTYREKHNLANGEHNRDGHSHEVSANFGIEGPSDHPAVIDTRRRVRRALLATTLLAQGTPMLCAGDEFGNSQQGNNNAYCQDNEIGWLDWSSVGGAFDDTDYVARLIALRRQDPLLRHAQWFATEPAADQPALHWLRPDGEPMRVDDWHDAHAHAFACQLADDAVSAPRWCLVFNPGPQPTRFRLPNGPWRLAVDSSGALGIAAAFADRATHASSVHNTDHASSSAHSAGHPSSSTHSAEEAIEIPYRSLVLFEHASLRPSAHPQETSR